MDTYVRFLFEFMSVFFSGVGKILGGIFSGLVQMFNIGDYLYIIETYRKDFSTGEWVLVVLAVIIMLVILALIILVIVFFVKKYFKFRKTLVEQESMLEEIASLNKEVATLVQEKEKILAMKVSQLGLKPNEEATVTEEATDEEIETLDDEDLDNIRFSKLHSIDVAFKDYKIQYYDNNFTLEELVEIFRNFAASRLGLYYTVQPSWRDRTELFGYFNEFTKKFNETEVLKAMYLAGYTDDVYVTVLDEMNIARVEYYFAEMLSILEMPSRDEWIIELVPSSWDTDPKKLDAGKLHIPGNMWYIGTINNDDSTFAVTDKVYDRAMPIDINDKGQVFEAVDTDPMNINSSYLEGLFAEAKKKYPLTSEMESKINDMDDYVIKHFRIAFGNRIVKQMKDFVATYVSCGGTEVDGVDYYIARKILRKFEQLNLAYIRDEIDPFIEFLDKSFGKENFNECKDYLLRLKKMI